MQISIKKNGFEHTAIIFNNQISSEYVGNLGWISSMLYLQIFLNRKKIRNWKVSKPIIQTNNLIIFKLN